MPKPLFSKTSYIKSLQCHKALYLYKKHPSVRDPLTPERKDRYQLGHRIGIKAHELYPMGIDASSQSPHAYKENIRYTQQLVEQCTPAIYEAAFIYNSTLVYCDMLLYRNGKWKLAEVKSNESISAVYKDDLAIQYYVVRGTGIEISSAVLVTLKEEADERLLNQPANEIFNETDLTEYCISRHQQIEEEIATMKMILAQKKLPETAMGAHCMTPYRCDFTGFCRNQDQPIREGLFSEIK